MCCNVDWILTEGSQVPKADNSFWNILKRQVIYIAEKNLHPCTWDVQVKGYKFYVRDLESQYIGDIT